MAEPVTQSDLAAAIGPVRGRLDQLGQKVEYVERQHQAHLEDAERDRVELREHREWMIRAETRAATQGAWIKGLFGTSVVGFGAMILGILDLIRRLGS